MTRRPAPKQQKPSRSPTPPPRDGHERVILVGLDWSGAEETEATMEELGRLVETAGGTVLESHIQGKDRPDPATFIGKGKVEEIAQRAIDQGAHAVVFDDELKPVQQRNLEEAINAKVIDRTRLILDIFATRARTREGKLQVELAQMNYMLPRITEKFGTFEQQVGGIGTRGPGERKLEVDKRRIRERMVHLEKQIEKIRSERAIQRDMRRSVPVPQIALVGYTNAGKSTLLNALLKMAPTGSAQPAVYADDKLFATLDPTTRRIGLGGGHIVLFSDTVGFIRKLPTQLVAAFRATLEEVANADLLLHVVDASDPSWQQQHDTVLKIIKDLKLDELPRLTAYNKMDRLSPTQRRIFNSFDGVVVSAGKGEGLQNVLQAVEHRLARQWVEKKLFFTYSDGGALSQIHQFVQILSQKSTTKGVRLHVRAHPAALANWTRYEEKS